MKELKRKSSFDPGASAELGESAHGRLRRAILEGELSPGEAVSQGSIATTLGVPRSSLRESTALLVQEGLLEGEGGRLRVAPIGAEELDELYGSRICLESLAISMTVPRLTQAEHYELEERLGEMRASSRNRDLAAWNRAHRAFHELLSARAGARLGGTIRNLRELCGRYRRRLLAEPRDWGGSSEHAAIAEACHRCDSELARGRLARHLARTALTLVTQIAPGHEPVAVREALRIFSTPPPRQERTNP